MSDQLRAPAAFRGQKRPQRPLNRRPFKPQKGSGCSGENKSRLCAESPPVICMTHEPALFILVVVVLVGVWKSFGRIFYYHLQDMSHKFLRNVGVNLSSYTISRFRRLTCSCSCPYRARPQMCPVTVPADNPPAHAYSLPPFSAQDGHVRPVGNPATVLTGVICAFCVLVSPNKFGVNIQIGHHHFPIRSF